MAIVTQEQAKRIENFQKYARILSEKFDVTIVFDGVKAETNGRVISIPNLINLNDEELDFLYAITLHEIGHIKYSDFSKDFFKHIKSAAMHFGVNALEDAYVENRLMKDYAGANDIFEQLYNKFANNGKFMERVLGKQDKKAPVWFVVCLLLHEQLVNLKNKETLAKTFDKRVVNQAKKFIASISDITSEIKLNSSQDSLAWGKKIYDRFFKEKEDKTQKFDVEGEEKAVAEAQKKLDELNKQRDEFMKKLEEMRSEYDKLKEEMKIKRQEYQKFWKENKKDFKEKSKKVDSAEDALDSKEDIIKFEEKLDKKLQQYQKKMEKMEKLKKALEQAKKDVQDFPNDKQLQEALKKIQERVEKMQKSLSETAKKIAKDRSRLEYTKNNFIKSAQGKTEEELRQDIADNKGQVQSIENQVQQKYDEYRKAKFEMQQKARDMRGEAQNFSSKTTKLIKQTSQEFEKNGVPINMMPKFQENPSWPEGDQVQRDFDKDVNDHTPQICVNGVGSSGSNLRDIITLVDKANHDLKDLDLSEIFKKQVNFSKLESVNDMIAEIANTERVEAETGKTTEFIRQHIPSTTQYDTVKEETYSDGHEIEIIRQRNSELINQLKNIFKVKFKFNKKVRFKANQEEGNIDTRTLWKVPHTDDTRLFEMINPKFENKVSAAVAIDISGSQEKAETEYGAKLKELAVFLSDALKAAFIKNEVIGYSAPVCDEMRETPSTGMFNRTKNKLETIVYKKVQDEQNGLQNIKTVCNDNSDAESIRIVANRILQQRSQRRVLFVITDGRPFLSNSNIGILDKDLRDTLVWCKANKIEVIALGFNDEPKNFYTNYCKITKWQDLLDFFWKNLS